jgi:hypothetical protein
MGGDPHRLVLRLPPFRWEWCNMPKPPDVFSPDIVEDEVFTREGAQAEVSVFSRPDGQYGPDTVALRATITVDGRHRVLNLPPGCDLEQVIHILTERVRRFAADQGKHGPPDQLLDRSSWVVDTTHRWEPDNVVSTLFTWRAWPLVSLVWAFLPETVLVDVVVGRTHSPVNVSHLALKMFKGQDMRRQIMRQASLQAAIRFLGRVEAERVALYGSNQCAKLAEGRGWYL